MRFVLGTALTLWAAGSATASDAVLLRDGAVVLRGPAELASGELPGHPFVEPLAFVYRVDGPGPVEVRLPTRLATGPRWRELARETASRPDRWELRLSLYALAPGEGPLRLEAWSYRVAGGEWRECPAQTFSIRVVGPAPTDDTPRDITGILPTAASPTRIGLIASLTGLALAALVGGAWLWNRRRTTPRDPVAWALNRLTRIEQARAPDARRRLAALGAVTRAYLARAHGVAAPRLATADLLAAVASHPRLAYEAPFLRALFAALDEAKFAPTAPPAIDAILRDLRVWLERERVSRASTRTESRPCSPTEQCDGAPPGFSDAPAS